MDDNTSAMPGETNTREQQRLHEEQHEENRINDAQDTALAYQTTALDSAVPDSPEIDSPSPMEHPAILSNGVVSAKAAIDADAVTLPSSLLDTTTAATSSPSSSSSASFYNSLELELDSVSPTVPSFPSVPAALASALPIQPQPQPDLTVQPIITTALATPSSETPSTPSTESNVTPSTTTKFGSKKIRVSPGSNISRRITMLAAGKNENNSDLHTTDHTKASDASSSSNGRESPDPNDYPDSFFEELLRQDQTTVSRSFTTMPKPTPRPTNILASKNSLPIRLPSGVKNTSSFNGTTNGESSPVEAAFVRSDDLEEDLKRLESELVKTKETKAKAEADAKSQRVTVMSLKTEIQLVRNVLKRRETELGDVKDMSSAYEGELSELRQKLEKSERQLSRGQGEMEAKVRALERMRDESIERIQTLDQEIKKLRSQLQEAEKKNSESQAEILGLREELEELGPFREAANAQRELNATEPAKVKELSLQITDLEDTRDMQAALIEELETKISTVEAEALEFKGKAELEYEALSDGFKVLKTRRSEEIKVLKAELEQHKLQEQIIEKLQADIDQLQSALVSVANSQSTENARINKVTAELNEALALKDQEVVEVRQNMTEFEESHNRLVNSLQATLATINEEADAARKSRDEAVTALESLREELEALRHSLPINKHMSLSQWSAEQQQSQQEQLQAIRDLEEKLDGQVEGVKVEQQRAGILEANTKRKSQQLTLDMEHHLQLSSAIVKKTSAAELVTGEKSSRQHDEFLQPPSETKADGKDMETSAEAGTVSVRTMLKFLSQLQGRSSTLPEIKSHVREGTEATIIGDSDLDFESQLRVYLTNLNDTTLVEPWAKEKELEGEISRLEHRIQSLLGDLTAANQKSNEAQDALKNAQAQHEVLLQEEREQRDELERLERQEREENEHSLQEQRRLRDEEIQHQQHSIESKEQELSLREASLREKELSLRTKEQELVKEEQDLQKRSDHLPATPPFSAPITPFGSPGNGDLLPELMAAHHQRSIGQEDDGDDEATLAAKEGKRQQEEVDRQQQAEMAAQQVELIKALEEKIANLEKRGSVSASLADEQSQLPSSFPSPPMTATPRASAALPRIGSQSTRSSLLNNPPDTPPPTIALPPIPTSPEYNDVSTHSPRSSSPVTEGGGLSPRNQKFILAHSVSSESLSNKAATAAAIEAAVTAAVSKSQEAQKELASKLKQSEAELNKSRSKNKELESELVTVAQTNKQGDQSLEFEMQKLKQENTELAQVLEEIRKSLDQAQNQVRGLEGLKTQLETQVQKERQDKDEAIRAQDRLKTQLEEEMQKKKGFLCF